MPPKKPPLNLEQGNWSPDTVLRYLESKMLEEKREAEAKLGLSDKVVGSKIREDATPRQKLVYDDKNKLVSVIGGRRAGKSTGLLGSDFEYCMGQPGVHVLYVGISKPHCREIYFPIVQQFEDTYKIGTELKYADMKVKFPNGSTITMFGAETRQDVAKLRGRKFHRITIDEAQDHPDEILQMLIAVTKPSLADYQGQLRMAGTCGQKLSGIWYEASTSSKLQREAENGMHYYTNWDFDPAGAPKEKFLWSRHHWTAKDNLKMPHIWAEHLETKAMMGWTDENPTWRREYLAEWVENTDVLVYAVRRWAHTWNGSLPWEDDRLDKCHFLLGADFGFRHGTAAVILCYVDDEPFIYEFLSAKRAGMSPDDTVDFFKGMERMCPKPIEFRVGDPGYGGLIIMEGFKKSHGMPFEVADKLRKYHYIELLNAALDGNLVRFRPGSPVLDEMEDLRWKPLKDNRQDRRKEDDENSPNDLCDAMLYVFRYARNRYVSPKVEQKQETLTPEQREKLAYINRRTDRYWWET